MKNKMYSIEETAKILNVHAITVRRYIKEGKIVASKIGGKWNITSSSIEELLDKSINIKKSNDKIKDFTENFSTKDKKISVCSIINVKSESPEELGPICNELMTAINANDPLRKWVNFEYMFLQEEHIGRFTIYGNPKFVGKLLSIVGKYEE